MTRIFRHTNGDEFHIAEIVGSTIWLVDPVFPLYRAEHIFHMEIIDLHSEIFYGEYEVWELKDEY